MGLRVGTVGRHDVGTMTNLPLTPDEAVVLAEILIHSIQTDIEVLDEPTIARFIAAARLEAEPVAFATQYARHGRIDPGHSEQMEAQHLFEATALLNILQRLVEAYPDLAEMEL